MTEEITPTPREREAVARLLAVGLAVVFSRDKGDGDVIASVWCPIDGSSGVSMCGWGKTVGDALMSLANRIDAVTGVAARFRKAVE